MKPRTLSRMLSGISLFVALWCSVAAYAAVDMYFTGCEPVEKRHPKATADALKKQGIRYACDNQKLNPLPQLLKKYGTVYSGQQCFYDKAMAEYHCFSARPVSSTTP